MLTWALMWAATKGIEVPALVVLAALVCDCLMVLGVAEAFAK